jgi:hypothetical protein
MEWQENNSKRSWRKEEGKVAGKAMVGLKGANLIPLKINTSPSLLYCLLFLLFLHYNPPHYHHHHQHQHHHHYHLPYPLATLRSTRHLAVSTTLMLAVLGSSALVRATARSAATLVARRSGTSSSSLLLSSFTRLASPASTQLQCHRRQSYATVYDLPTPHSLVHSSSPLTTIQIPLLYKISVCIRPYSSH